MQNNVVGCRNVSLRVIELGASCIHSTRFKASACTLRNNSDDVDDFDDK